MFSHCFSFGKSEPISSAYVWSKMWRFSPLLFRKSSMCNLVRWNASVKISRETSQLDTKIPLLHAPFSSDAGRISTFLVTLRTDQLLGGLRILSRWCKQSLPISASTKEGHWKRSCRCKGYVHYSTGQFKESTFFVLVPGKKRSSVPGTRLRSKICLFSIKSGQYDFWYQFSTIDPFFWCMCLPSLGNCLPSEQWLLGLQKPKND